MLLTSIDVNLNAVYRTHLEDNTHSCTIRLTEGTKHKGRCVFVKHKDKDCYYQIVITNVIINTRNEGHLTYSTSSCCHRRKLHACKAKKRHVAETVTSTPWPLKWPLRPERSRPLKAWTLRRQQDDLWLSFGTRVTLDQCSHRGSRPLL